MKHSHIKPVKESLKGIQLLSFSDFVDSRPMLARPCDSLEAALENCTVAENKYDGMRLYLVKFEDGTWDVFARSMKSYKGVCPHIDKITSELPNGTIIDGEAVLFAGGAAATLTYAGNPVVMEMPDFSASQSIMRSNPEKAILRQKEKGLITLCVFDMPWIAGRNISGMTGRERRAMLEVKVNEINHPNFTLSPLVDLTQENLERVFAIGGEGLMAKNIDAGSEYSPGAKTKSWLKLKSVQTADCVVMGYTDGKGKYEALFGAIIYGQYKDGTLTRRGSCAGMDDAVRIKLHNNREQHIGQVIEIAYMGIEKEGFRHPRLKHFRDDKPAIDCTWDEKNDIKTTKIASAPKKKTAKAAGKQAVKKLVAISATDHLTENTAASCSPYALNLSGGSSKFYRIFVTKEDEGYTAWAMNGKWDQDTNAPKTRSKPIVLAAGISKDEATMAANKRLAKKLTEGYRGQLIG